MTAPAGRPGGRGGAREDARFEAAATDAGTTVSAFVRAQSGAPWAAVKRLIATGKVFVDGAPERAPGRRLGGGETVEIRMRAPRRQDHLPQVAIVHDDPHVVVVDKPSGVSSVPYEPREGGTAMDLLREAWRRRGGTNPWHPLFVVHRIDKATSGLLAFAKSKRAERGLAAQFRAHTAARAYLCVAHGQVAAARIESFLVADRGDRLRGSARRPGRGKRAVTHVEPIEALAGATLCRVTLETGKTHQIRIHLSERGHPLVGDPVYIRDHARAGARPLPAPRLLLHAATLAFLHPVSGEPLAFESPLPADFEAALARMRQAAGGARSPDGARARGGSTR